MGSSAIAKFPEPARTICAGARVERKTPGVQPRAQFASVENDGNFRIEPLAHDVVDENREREPECRAVVGADGSEFGGGSARIDECRVAVFYGELPGKVADIARTQRPLRAHGRSLREPR